ncbi:concanavalin A-like lectin/glucanase domain-containing protein [Jimgerdemannia flammicorona]|uniref:Concanavalin A-like lectin/glucanase domain-containing protein n=1 Tax=Jimgerdemannia flammicorona TaxID=994334 RepID=A0A433QSS5_9FUNG|nr:concanavalin A-like lectin/glucanase domain-containing protein [Jimgerdemannia flammicorona]
MDNPHHKYALPSYDYASTTNFVQSQRVGAYNNASEAAFGRSERFTADFAAVIDSPSTPETCRYLLQHGVPALRMDVAQQILNALVVLPDELTVEFYPQKTVTGLFGAKKPHLPRKPVLPKGDTDRTIQCLFPFILPQEMRRIAAASSADDKSEPPPTSPQTEALPAYTPEPSFAPPTPLNMYTPPSYPPPGVNPSYPPPRVNPSFPGPAPMRQAHYFEVTIVANPYYETTCVAIGLCTRPYPLFRMPGWNKHSVGWHSDDGNKFCDDSEGGLPYAEGFGEVGDVVGCGYLPAEGAIFFTKNGRNVGEAFRGIKHTYFPSFGADGPVTVKFNFGRERFRFKFALEGFGLVWAGGSGMWMT